MTSKEYQDKFEKIARGYINRKGIEEVLNMISQTDFYTAPASTRYHDSHESGLVKHSLEVGNQLLKMRPELEEYELESLAIVGLFHDICKIGFYTTEMRNAKNEQGKWVKVPYYTVDDKFPMGHGEKSVIMLMQLGFELTVDEMLAIRWHMGGFVPQEERMALSKAYEESNLALYLHLADMKATYKS